MPSPCGANAICKEQRGAGSCSCISDYIGNPYEGCRPECSLNSDCPSNQACINNKCADPCRGTCGENAYCQVINHVPSCNCPLGYTGEPFTLCYRAPETVQRKTLFKTEKWVYIGGNFQQMWFPPIHATHRLAAATLNVGRLTGRLLARAFLVT